MPDAPLGLGRGWGAWPGRPPPHLLLGNTSLPGACTPLVMPTSWRRGSDRGSPSADWSDGPPAAQPGKCRLDHRGVAPGSPTGMHAQEGQRRKPAGGGAQRPLRRSLSPFLSRARAESAAMSADLSVGCRVEHRALTYPTGKEPARHRPPRSQHTSPGATPWALTCPRRP